MRRGAILGVNAWRVYIALVITLACLMLAGCSTAQIAGGNDGLSGYVYQPKEEVLERVSAIESTLNPNMAEVGRQLEERGFGHLDVTSHYDMDGAYIEEVVLDWDSDDIHPTYDALYESADGAIWMLHIVNGQFMASPLAIKESPFVGDGADMPDRRVLYVEDCYVTSYDASANEYIVAIPDSAEIDMRVIERISADTLDEKGKNEETRSNIPA